MKLYTFSYAGQHRIGAESNGQLIDLPAAYSAMQDVRGGKARAPTALPSEMLTFLRLGDSALNVARDIVAFMQKRPALPVGVRATYLLDQVKVLAPIRPGKILCSGINYKGHAQENPGAKMPTEPFFFSKLPSAVIGPNEPIVHPAASQQLDYEVEFAVVIGRKMRNTPEAGVM